MAQMIRSDEMDFATYMAQTDAKQKVRPASDFMSEIIADLGQPSREVKSFLPWDKTHSVFAFRPGEVTLWGGVNGQGKSLMSGQAMLSLMAQNERICIASFEMKPRRTLERMVRQFSGQRPPEEWMRDPAVLASYKDVYEQFSDYSSKLLWLYDQQGTVQTETIMGVMRYAAHELKCRHFVVDSLMKCVKGEDDYNGQKEFVDRITALARDTGMHIHLVHHIRKLGSETDMPGKTDVKGSGSITDQVDNLLLVWRNKNKERDREAGKAINADVPDAMLICDKQRNGEWEGRIALWFEPESTQYVAMNGAPAMNFSSWPHRSL